jgi:hypothetical protein
MSLVPYKNYAKILRDSEAGPGTLADQLGRTNTGSWRFDPGGWSYGMYQLATFGHKLAPGPRVVGPKSDKELLNPKSPFHTFLEWAFHIGDDRGIKLQKALANGGPDDVASLAKIAAGVGNGQYIDNTKFRMEWARFAYNQTSIAEELQTGFHARQYYWPAHAELKKFGIDLLNRSEAVNQLVTDYANVGPGHFSNAVKSIKPNNSMSDKELIEAIASYYAELFDRFGKAQPKFAVGWANRFGSKSSGKKGKVELECLKMLGG